MPAAEGEVLTSIVGGQPRSPFSQHIFVGGNRFMLSLLRNNADEAFATVEDEQFVQKMAQVEAMLGNQTAELTVGAEKNGENLLVSIKISNLAGHKFPTGFPSRRAWLHVTVIDRDGEIYFESGKWQQDGSIFGNDNDENALMFEPHYSKIISAEQVQIYEAIIADSEGQVITGLMYADSYVKDNRIPPDGFSKESVPTDISVIGNAFDDENFGGGEDLILYEIPLENSTAPWQIEIELLYQSIGYRWLQKFYETDTIESQKLVRYLESVPNEPVVIDSVVIEIEP